MDPASPERLKLLKRRYPGMDLEMVQFFARTMTTVHDITGLMEGYFARFGLSKGRFMVLVQLHQEDDPNGVNLSDVLSWYRVSSAEVVDSRARRLVLNGAAERISLVTCYPFDSPFAGGPLRYVVTALPADGADGDGLRPRSPASG